MTQPRYYPLYRPDFLTTAFSAGKASGANAMLPWSLIPWDVDVTDTGGFGFGPDDPSFQPVASAIKFQHDKVLRRMHPSSLMQALMRRRHANGKWRLPLNHGRFCLGLAPPSHTRPELQRNEGVVCMRRRHAPTPAAAPPRPLSAPAAMLRRTRRTHARSR